MSRIHPDRCNLETSFHLLSTSVSSSKDGLYAFDQIPILLSTETMRRLLARTTRAMKNFNAVSHRWQAVYVHIWLVEFLFPVLQLDELCRNVVLIPHYEALGEQIPCEQVGYEFLQSSMSSLIEEIVELSQFICASSLDSSDENDNSSNRVQVAQDNLIRLLKEFEKNLERRYSAEEEFWPRILRKFGNSEVVKMMHTKVDYIKSMGTTGHSYMAAVLFTLGHSTDRAADDELDIPWCGPKMRHGIVTNYPFVVKFLPPCVLFQPYLKFRSIIDIVHREKCSDDILNLIPYYQQLAGKERGDGGVGRLFNQQKRKWNLIPVQWRHILQSFFTLDVSDHVRRRSSCTFATPWMQKTSSKLTESSSFRSQLEM
jgi:hypothetical protein